MASGWTKGSRTKAKNGLEKVLTLARNFVEANHENSDARTFFMHSEEVYTNLETQANRLQQCHKAYMDEVMKISDMEDEEYEKIDEEDSRIQDLLTEAKICEGQLKVLQSIREKEMNESMRKTPDLRLEKELAKIVSKLADLQVEDRKASARPVEHAVKLPKFELP